MAMKPTPYPRVSSPRVAVRRRSPIARFALPVLAVLIAAFWLVAEETRERVAPPGVATPAGPRHADPKSARVASMTPEERHDILLCQALGPAAPYDICGVDCSSGCCCRRGWEAARAIDWQAYAQGEYVGHARLDHVPEYRLRVDDQLDMTYRLTRDETPTPYRLNVGDEIQVESFTDPDINRNLLIQPDGTITLRLLGQVHATGRTVTQLRDALEELYKKYYKIPAITVTPLKVNTKLEDLRAVIDRRAGIGGQSQTRADYARGHDLAAGHRHRAGPRADAARTASRTERAVPRGRRGDSDHSDPGGAGAALRLRAGRGEQPRPLRVDWPRPPPSRPSAWPAVGAWGRTCGRSWSSAAATIGGCWPR